SVDLQMMYEQIMGAMSVLQPEQATLINTAIQTFESFAAVSIRNDLLVNSRGAIINYAREGADEAEDSVGATVLATEGGADVVASFNTLLTKLTSGDSSYLKLQSSDFQGFTIWESDEDS